MNEHINQRCVIMGNGPSLNTMDLSFLKYEVVFGTNKIFLGFEKFNFTPTYYVCINKHLFNDNKREILPIPCKKFLSAGCLEFTEEADANITYMDSLADFSFSPNINKGIYEGWTVTYACLQIAYHMGFSEVYLIGVDHNYVMDGEPNQIVVAHGEDVNHFDGNYFSEGTAWFLPDLERSAYCYKLADLYYRFHNRMIYDCTENGRLNVFEKRNYREVFYGNKPD